VGIHFSLPKRSSLPQGKPYRTFLQISFSSVFSSYTNVGRLAWQSTATILRKDVDMSCNMVRQYHSPQNYLLLYYVKVINMSVTHPQILLIEHPSYKCLQINTAVIIIILISQCTYLLPPVKLVLDVVVFSELHELLTGAGEAGSNKGLRSKYTLPIASLAE
jgi:hypothetical protein